jgi:23S rRNA U2552 (ribose-2'-O)-methylase RlmE/FtsJ
MKLKAILLCMMLFITVAFSETIEGTWVIKSLKKTQAFNIASSIGYGLMVRFNKDHTLTKLDMRTHKDVHTKHAWKLQDDGKVINIEFVQPNASLIAKFVLKSTTNDYLKVIGKVSKDCYKLDASRSSKSSKNPILVSMCKVK